MKTLVAVVLLLCAVTLLPGQSPPRIVITGNSIAFFETNLQLDIFPELTNPSDVLIRGYNGATCTGVEGAVLNDAFGQNLTERSPEVVVLIDTTNDWQQGTLTRDLISCLSDTITLLLSHKPTLKIVLLTTPPYVSPSPPPPCSPLGDKRSVIEDYNAAIPALQSQSVIVVDAWTPFLQLGGQGWANPGKMTGPCGIHPGPFGTFTGGQPTLAAVFHDTVISLLY